MSEQTPFVGLHALLTEKAHHFADNIFALYRDQPLTYRDLERHANRLAAQLLARGVGRDKIVGLFMEHSLELMVAMLAVMKAGGAFMPLDPALPAERLAFMLGDAQPHLLLCLPHLAERLPSGSAPMSYQLPALPDSEEPPLVSATVTAEQLVYVLYTSGSTGRPFGVMLPQRRPVNDLTHIFSLTVGAPPTRQLLFTPMSTLAFVGQYLTPFGNGATLVIAEADKRQDVGYLTDLMERHQATSLHATPSLLRALLHEPRFRAYRGLRMVSSSGEALSPTLLEHFYAHFDIPLITTYGATEVGSIGTWLFSSAKAPPYPIIGYPSQGVELLLLDEAQQPVAPGEIGEIHVGGQKLALRYLNQPELTSARFIPHPFSDQPGARLFRTGDLGRLHPDGILEYVGRADFQGKVRGVRVDLTEVEEALVRVGGVRSAVAVVREDSSGAARLVAYALPDGEPPPVDTLRRALAERLPPEAVPAQVLFLDHFPMTATDKVDRRALPPPPPTRPHLQVPYAPPRDEAEQWMVALWERVLGVAPVGIHDDFFDLGGSSLMAAEVLAEGRSSAAPLPLSLFAEAPTVARLAAALAAGHGAAQGWSHLVPLQSQGTHPPFFFVPPAAMSPMAFVPLARMVAADQPFYGLKPAGLEDDTPPHQSIEAMAAAYVAEVRALYPSGPYLLGGACLGATIALEMAHQLQQAGGQVAWLAVMDSGPPTVAMAERRQPLHFRKPSTLSRQLLHHTLRGTLPQAIVRYATGRRQKIARARLRTNLDARAEALLKIALDARDRHVGQPFFGPTTAFLSEQYAYGKGQGWAELLGGPSETLIMAGTTHRTYFSYETFKIIAAHIDRRGALAREHTPAYSS